MTTVLGRWRFNHRFMFNARRVLRRGEGAWLFGTVRAESGSVAATVIRLRVEPTTTGTRYTGRARPSAFSTVNLLFWPAIVITGWVRALADPGEANGWFADVGFTALVWLVLRVLVGGLAETRGDAVADLRAVLGGWDIDAPTTAGAPDGAATGSITRS